MVPKIHGKGTSFKGAAAYLLHDKGEAISASRVAWVETVNLATGSPHIAWRVMAATAMDAPRLKEAAGVKNTGRQSKDSVLHVSLAWAPDEKVSREEMSGFARRALQALKAGDRQAMIICHTDEKNPHVHLLINRVSPADGRLLSSSKEKLALSELALAYEKERGQVQCPEREANAAKRAQGEYVRAEKDIPRPEYEALKLAMTEIVGQIPPELRQQNPQGAALVRARMKKQFRAYLDGIKEQLRPEWRSLYDKQRQETQKAIQQKSNYLDRLLSAFGKRKDKSPAPSPAMAFQQSTAVKASWDQAGRQQKQRRERAGLARTYAAEIGKALQEIKFNCRAAIRQLFVAHDKGGASPAFGAAAAGLTPQPTQQQANTQRRVTQLSEKFKREGGLEPYEKWERPKPQPRPPGRKPKDKDKDHEPEF